MTAATMAAGAGSAAYRVCPTTGLKVNAQAEALIKVNAVAATVSLLIGGITVIVLAWTFVLTDIPGEGDAWPTSFAVYVAAFTIHWTLLTVVVTYVLWTAGRGEASVPRKRMRLLAVAAATITLALLISVSGTSAGSAAQPAGSRSRTVPRIGLAE